MNTVSSFLVTGGRAAFAAALLTLAAAAPALAVPATTADDVCAPSANPCNVTSVFDVTSGAVLDFGTRTVNVSGSGQFNFDINSGQILCGPFSASTTNPAIDANGLSTGGGSEGGTVQLKARRQCTAGPGRCSNDSSDPCNTNADCDAGATCGKTACIDVNDCQLGACDTRRCSLRPAKTCTSDLNCQLGPCGTNKRCTNAPTFTRCDTNADCDYGTCPAQLTCKNRAENPVACSTNTDCEFGACSVGTASITMNGPIAGNSDSPATIVLRAADNVAISKLVNLNSGSIGSDGGDFNVDAAAGAITLTAKINATGGGDSQGGTVELSAGTDVTLSEEININGGDFDGGALDVEAGRDIIINRSVLANSTAGAGFGGEVVLDAGRDLTINGTSALNKTTVETSGHTDIENFAGDGGTQDMTSGRHMSLNTNTRLLGTGSIPDGYGSDMFFDVGENLSLAGEVTAKADGLKGAGGFIEVLVGGTSSVTSAGKLDVTGGDGGGGVLELDSVGNTTFGGLADVSGSNGGSGGSSFFNSEGNTTVTGTFFVNGDNGGSLEVDACRITLASGGKLDNNVINGDNKLVSRESMKLLAGSEMTVGANGENVLVYRTAAKPPQISGLVSPAPTLVIDDTLVGCPVCGNLEVDQGETCDDGNFNNGDGCNSECQNEKCIQQTPGYPGVPLCDDNSVCTQDICNPNVNGGTCQHPAKNCADAHACTTDSCNPTTGVCEHVAVNALCNDNNDCTENICSVTTGCGFVANSEPCDDGDACTENDTCSNSECSGTVIQGCGVCGDGNVNAPEECDDGNNAFAQGQYCAVGCLLVDCGDTNNNGTITSSDALYVLKAAVGQVTCHVRVCDVTGTDGKITASDALRVLRKSVGQNVSLTCPTVS